MTDTDAKPAVQDAGRTTEPPDPTIDPVISPVVDDGAVTTHSPVPVVRSTPTRSPARDPEPTGRGVKLAKISRTGDRVFGGFASGSGVFLVLLVLFVGLFLLALALPSLLQDQDNFLTSRNWSVSGTDLRFGIAGLLWTTVLSSVLAMAMAVPVAVGVALFLTQYLHKRASGPVSFVVDLLAAVPSIIFGLWGLSQLGPFLAPAGQWLIDHLGWIPLFSAGVDPKGSVFVASVVLAIMILPIVTAISRDIFAQTPRDQVEAALALGSTRWEVIRTAVLPHGRSGVISASMLGLGRALGETIAVMIILTQPAPGAAFSPSIFAGGETFASKIANNASEFDTPSKTGAYIASGLVLFLVTFAVNAVARMIADRGSQSMSAVTNSEAPLDFRRPSGVRTVKNAIASFYVVAATVLAIIPLVWVLYTVISKGARLVFTSTWWLQSQRGITPRREGGGAYHAIIGTVEMALICAVIAVPIGVLGAIFLIEYARGKKAARAVSFTVDILSGIPSIVAALFIYALFITIFGLGRSGIAVSCALVLLMLPTVLRSTEEMLKLVPDHLREASYALGVPKWKTIVKVVIPTAFGGISTGVVLGLARVMGETAPLLILVSYAVGINFSPTSGTMGALPTMINSGRDQAQQLPGYERVWAAALTLIIIVMLLNLLARAIARASKLKEK